MEKFIYLDNAATTAMYDEAKEEMSKYLTEGYGNPSSLYKLGKEARQIIDNSRNIIAKTLGARPEEIYFTSGGTESDNWAIKCAPFIKQKNNYHVITSAIEHHAVLDSCQYLEDMGVKVDYISVDEYGMIKMDEIKEKINKDTSLVTIMFANNEVGTIEPVRDAARIARERGVLFHTDAVQAYGHIPINVHEMGIDMLSASAHKFGGPKGIGFLYIRNNIDIEPWVHGGGQENGMRSGTENVAEIAAMGKAAQISAQEIFKHMKRERDLREYLITHVMNEIPFVKLNGHRSNRLSNNASFSFKGIDGKQLLTRLDEDGIYASAGSACSAGNLKPSHVLTAMRVPEEYAGATIRFTLSWRNTYQEINRTVESLVKNVNILRK
ncbi:MAG: cysteine desulfurase family protein [Eubacterium sp.]